MDVNEFLSLWSESDNLIKEIYRVAEDRDTLGFYILCDQCIATNTVAGILGCIRGCMLKDTETFEWMMYCLSKQRGYEEILANFWIANWQIRMNNIKH